MLAPQGSSGDAQRDAALVQGAAQQDALDAWLGI